MLHVKVELRSSPIHGLGVFAAEPIASGTLVSAWNHVVDREFADDEIVHPSMPPCFREKIEHFGWRGPNGKWRMTLDEAKYTNHSATPNLVYLPTDAPMRRPSNPNARGMFAARDIAAGEELTEDYSTFDPDFVPFTNGPRTR